MKVESPAFENHMPIPKKYTCQGEDISPPLVFRDLPKGTKSLALVIDDPDAPSGTFDHWVVWNLSPDTKTLVENAKPSEEGINHFNKIGYGGPCPPPGSQPHRYFFKAYALDVALHLPRGSTKEELENAMEGHILNKAELIGTYKKS